MVACFRGALNQGFKTSWKGGRVEMCRAKNPLNQRNPLKMTASVHGAEELNHHVNRNRLTDMRCQLFALYSTFRILFVAYYVLHCVSYVMMDIWSTRCR